MCLNDRWIQMLYDESDPENHNTLYGQLARLAVHRAVYDSIFKMTTESEVDVSGTIAGFLKDGFTIDLAISIRRLLESNYWYRNGQAVKKPDNLCVVSMMSLAEELGDEARIAEVRAIKEGVGNSIDKVFAHNDLLLMGGDREIRLSTYDELFTALSEMHRILMQIGHNVNVSIPDHLVATEQEDWARAFDFAWRPENFEAPDTWYL